MSQQLAAWNEPLKQYFANSGAPLAGGFVYTYVAGSSTPLVTYQDINGVTPNAVPIALDAAGKCVIYAGVGTYKIDVQDSNGVSIDGYPLDNVPGTPLANSVVDATVTWGETVTAGQCVYLSDGSGGKTAGRWYKADSGNTYSSTLPEIGFVVIAGAGGSTGTARLIGRVTGLSGLSVTTSKYYVGVAGALTNVFSSAARFVGQADSTTSLIATPDPPSSTAAPVAVAISTAFETAARFTGATTGGGANTFGTSGLAQATGGAGGGSADSRWEQDGSNGGVFGGSPRFGARGYFVTKGSDGQAFIGLGGPTVAAAGITFTVAHIGFKITWSGSNVASLYATQANGAETASAALTTVVANDTLDLMLQVNGTGSVDYYWRKNGSAWSAATNLSTNLPVSVSQFCDAALSNVAMASASQFNWTGMSFTR